MNTTPDLLPRFTSVIRELPSQQIQDPRVVHQLRLASTRVGNRILEMIYAPFDYVNLSARIVVVGITPGRQQAANAILAAQKALAGGASNEEAARTAKTLASFSGPMRSNLVGMLDDIGIARWLGLSTTASLWDRDSNLIHFTSAIRYPVFVDGENWAGNPDLLRSAEMRQWLEAYTGSELSLLKDALLVPLGPKVSAALQHLAAKGTIDRSRILDGMPHPSTANSERIAYFLGNKPAANLSNRTNPTSIDASRAKLLAKIAAL